MPAKFNLKNFLKPTWQKFFILIILASITYAMDQMKSETLNYFLENSTIGESLKSQITDLVGTLIPAILPNLPALIPVIILFVIIELVLEITILWLTTCIIVYIVENKILK